MADEDTPYRWAAGTHMTQVVPIERAEDDPSAGGNIAIRPSDAVDSATSSSRPSWKKESNRLSLVENGFPSEYSEPSPSTRQRGRRRRSDGTIPVFDSDSGNCHVPKSLPSNEGEIPGSDEKASDENLLGEKAVEGHSTKEEVGDTASLARFPPVKSPKSCGKDALPSALDENGEPIRANNGDLGRWSHGKSHGLPAPIRGLLDSVHDKSNKMGTPPQPMIMGRQRESITAEFLARQREREAYIKRTKEEIADILRRVTEKDPAMPNIDEVFSGWSANPRKE